MRETSSTWITVDLIALLIIVVMVATTLFIEAGSR